MTDQEIDNNWDSQIGVVFSARNMQHKAPV